MKVVTDRADAAALPSRHHFAIFRLLAAARFPMLRPRVQRGIVLHLDEYQSSFENYTVAGIVWIIGSAYLIDALAHVVPLLLAAIIGIALSPLVLQFPFYVTGAIATAIHDGDNRRLNSIAVMSVLLIASTYYAMQQTWVCWPARAFLALTALNALAAPVAWLMRERMTAMEDRCVR